MFVVASSDLLKEFTLYADKIITEQETAIVQRAKGNNLVVMSMEQYNELQRKLYLLSKKDE